MIFIVIVFLHRIHALCQWLAQSALTALHKKSTTSNSSSAFAASRLAQESRSSGGGGGGAVPRTDAQHVQCVAAILWHCNTHLVSFDLQALVSQELLRLVNAGSSLLPVADHCG